MNVYFECPKCGFVLTFVLSNKLQKYVSICPYCNLMLEMEVRELERPSVGDETVDFTPDTQE